MQIFDKAAYQVLTNRRLALLLSATIAMSAGCGTSTKDAAAPVTSAAPTFSTAAPSTSTPFRSVSAPPSTPAHSSRATSSSSPVPTNPPTKSAQPSQPSPPSATDGCQAGALAVAALRGSGAAGHQYAFLQFTNKSANTCTLTGFPGVVLRRAGAVLGKPATRSDKARATVKLPPGDSATARLVDDSTCEAEKSDSVQIIPPNLTEAFLVPLSLRGCALTIDPVVAG